MTTLLDVIRGQAPLPSAPPERAQLIDTPEACELRYRLLLWARRAPLCRAVTGLADAARGWFGRARPRLDAVAGGRFGG